jgi:hypothetical protein
MALFFLCSRPGLQDPQTDVDHLPVIACHFLLSFCFMLLAYAKLAPGVDSSAVLSLGFRIQNRSSDPCQDSFQEVGVEMNIFQLGGKHFAANLCLSSS